MGVTSWDSSESEWFFDVTPVVNCRRGQLADRELFLKPIAILKQSLRASMHSRDIRSIHGRYRGQQADPSYR